MTPKEAIRGILPIAPTPFTESGGVDFDGQRRVLGCMIDQGVDAICLLANFSEQFLLTDDERDRLTELGLGHVAGRRPVIVTCSHFSTRIAAERGRRAAAAGAALPVLRPPPHGSAPRSGVALGVAFLARLAAEVPSVSYAKIEVPGTAAKLRSLIGAAGAAIA